MAVDRHRSNTDWYVTDESGALYPQMRDGVLVAVLMDIRRELRAIRQNSAIWNCYNFQRIPSLLDAMALDARRRNRQAKRRAAEKRKATLAAKKR